MDHTFIVKVQEAKSLVEASGKIKITDIGNAGQKEMIKIWKT